MRDGFDVRRAAMRAASPVVAVATAATCPAAHAGFGAYLPGLGARSSGAGGAVYSLIQDTTPLSSNPALARVLGTRVDTTLAFVQGRSNAYIEGNLLGPDQKANAIDNDYFFPYAGATLEVSDTLSLGVTGFLAGFGAVYEPSPFARFGGDDKASISLFQVGLSTILAYEIVSGHNLGVSINLSYDALDLEGLGKTLALFSETPEHFTDQGLDGVVGLGATIGWYGQFTPWLSGGAAYRTKTYSKDKINEYEGLLPNQGSLQFPAFFGGGLALTPVVGWTFAVELQRYDYDGVQSFSSGLAQFPQHKFGSDEGPGFGWRSQNIVRLALIYEPSPALTLRAGYAHGTQQIPRSETLFAALAPGPTRTYYSLGATWFSDSGWEWTAAAGYEPPTRVRGENSIPLLAGGGEADIENSFPTLSLSVSRNFQFQLIDAK